MDNCFDLDLALTMEEEEEEEEEENSCSSSTSTGNIKATTTESFPIIAAQMYMPKVTAVGACTICMEGFQSSNGIGKQVPCGHVYHPTCITKWLSLHHSCPLCRSNFSGHRKTNPPTPVASV